MKIDNIPQELKAVFSNPKQVGTLKLHPISGKPLKSIENVKIWLDNWAPFADRVWYDTFNHKMIVRVPLPWDDKSTGYSYPRDWTDHDRAQLALAVEKSLEFSSVNLIDTALTAVASEHLYHPITRYLDGLEWDGIPRLDTFFVDYLGVRDSEYARAVTRKAFVAAVRRIKKPGTKFDTMVILTGPQGGYKSTLLRLMGYPWYSDSLRTFEGKDAMEALQGVWIMEVSELEAMRRSEVTAVKAFLSKTSDRYRAAYGRYVGEYPRQCILFGTTNSKSFLRDITGGRRFFPLQTDAQPRTKNVMDDLENERDQLWAEAAAYEASHEPIYLTTPELQAEAQLEQEQYREADPWEAIIQLFIDRPVPIDWDSWPLLQRSLYWSGGLQGDQPDTAMRRRVCAHEIWVEAMCKRPEDMTQTDSRRINAIMSSMPGWESRGKMPPSCPYGRQRAFVRLAAVSPDGAAQALPEGNSYDEDWSAEAWGLIQKAQVGGTD